jgi:hypothetical protein
MFEESIMSTMSTFEVPSNLPEVNRELLPEMSPEVVEASPKVRAKSAKEIADEYKVSDKTIQTWFKAVFAAYSWVDPKTLKVGSGNKIRYTPLCQTLITEYRAVAAELSEEDWIASVHAANPENFTTPNASSAPTEIPVSLTEVIPHSSIQVLNPEQCSELDRLAALAESMQVYKPSQVDLNGSQDEILDLLTVFAVKVQDLEQTNLERIAALGDRKQKLATAENVLAHFINVGKGLESQSAQINDEAKEVAPKESDLKKLLDAMQATLS